MAGDGCGRRSSRPTVARSSALNTSVSSDTRGSFTGSSCVAISLLSLFHWRELSVEARRLPVIASHGARYSGTGRVQEPPSSLPMVAASQQRRLVYRIECYQHGHAYHCQTQKVHRLTGFKQAAQPLTKYVDSDHRHDQEQQELRSWSMARFPFGRLSVHLPPPVASTPPCVAPCRSAKAGLSS